VLFLFGRPGGLSPLAFFERLKKAFKKELKQRLNPWRLCFTSPKFDGSSIELISVCFLHGIVLFSLALFI